MIVNNDYKNAFKEIEDKSIDLVITDPPYKFVPTGGGIINKRNYTDKLDAANCCNFNPVEFLDLLKPKMKKFYGYFFCNKALVPDYLNWAVKNRMTYDVLVMAKTNPIPAYNAHHLSDLEYIILIRAAGTYFGKDGILDDYRKFYITSTGKKEYHPAQKPVELLKRFVTVSSRENDTILDPFMGSGSTGVACKEKNRNFIGIEMDSSYFDIAKKRLESEQFPLTLRDE